MSRRLSNHVHVRINRPATGTRWLPWVAPLFLVLLLAAPADASVYWANRDGTTIGRAAVSGKGAEQGFIADARAPCGVAVNGTHVHWFNRTDGAVGRANLNGSGINQSFISGATDEGGVGGCGVAADSVHLYWANGSRLPSIGRANLDGGSASIDPDFVRVGTSSACAVAVDQAHIYWAGAVSGGAGVGRADLDGGDADGAFIGGGGTGCGVAVNASHIYWSSTGSSTGVARATLDGNPAGVDRDFIALPNPPCGIAVDRTHLYWGNASLNTIGRARLDGTGVNQSFVGGALGPCGVAVDALPLPVPPPVAAPPGDSDPPETTIDKGPKKKTKKRKARFEFSSDEAGASFECGLDGKGFTPCVSPFKKKVKRRRHSFEVRAIDRTGNADPTPAAYAWKVKKGKGQTSKGPHWLWKRSERRGGAAR